MKAEDEDAAIRKARDRLLNLMSEVDRRGLTGGRQGSSFPTFLHRANELEWNLAVDEYVAAVDAVSPGYRAWVRALESVRPPEDAGPAS